MRETCVTKATAGLKRINILSRGNDDDRLCIQTVEGPTVYWVNLCAEKMHCTISGEQSVVDELVSGWKFNLYTLSKIVILVLSVWYARTRPWVYPTVRVLHAKLVEHWKHLRSLTYMLRHSLPAWQHIGYARWNSKQREGTRGNMFRGARKDP